jgi:hypothetical protein
MIYYYIFKIYVRKLKKMKLDIFLDFQLQKQKSSSNSGSIDFLLVKYSSKKQGYNFVSFDVSVSKQKS